MATWTNVDAQDWGQFQAEMNRRLGFLFSRIGTENIVANSIKDFMLDVGFGTGQISAEDFPVLDTAEYYTSNNVESVLAEIGDSLSGKQPLNSTLTALSGYNTNGILVQTTEDTFTGRTITGTVNQIIVANGDGVSGNPVLSLPQDIHATATPTFGNLTIGTGEVDTDYTLTFDGNNNDGKITWFETEDYFRLEDDFFLLKGVYDDLALPIVPRTTGAGRPKLVSFDGDIREYQMAVNDVTDVNATELIHKWEEGTTIELHVHWVTNGVDVDNRAVKWQLTYTWANIMLAGSQTAFPTATISSAESIIPADTPDRTHYNTSVISFTPTGGKIGAYLAMALRRITSDGTAPTDNPWLLAVGVHFKANSMGSRTIGAK